MNFRLYSIAFLFSVLPIISSATNELKFNRGDFVGTERKTSDGDTVLKVRLSKSGKAKIKKLNKEEVFKKIDLKVDGGSSALQIKELFSGSEIEVGTRSNIIVHN